MCCLNILFKRAFSAYSLSKLVEVYLSALPEVEANIRLEHNKSTISELSTEQTEAWALAYGTPEQALHAEVPVRVLFLASQIGMTAAEDWQVRADWVSVYLKAVGPSHDY